MEGSRAAGRGAAYGTGGLRAAVAAGEGLGPVAKQLRLSPDHSGDRRKVLARKKGVRSVFCKPSSYMSLSALTRALPRSLIPSIPVLGVQTRKRAQGGYGTCVIHMVNQGQGPKLSACDPTARGSISSMVQWLWEGFHSSSGPSQPEQQSSFKN